MTEVKPSPHRRWSDGLFGGEDARQLPERVRVAIERQQQDGEILVGWAQMALVAFFGLFYSISPKTFPADAPFEPVPITLTVYGAFTVVRLVLAHIRRLPRWFLALSVVIDMAMLLICIWSFHLQYQQPAAFYLKASTLLYVFIFIALRSLRFEAGYVLLAGAAASLGWLALVFYAVADDPMGMPITRSYVMYMTSSSILIGAEVDKIVSIIIVTLILSLAIIRAKRLLIRSVSEQIVAQDLSRFFDPEVAARIKKSDRAVKAGEGELRQAATMFVDLRGFTPLAATLKPNELIALLGEYQSRMVPAIQQNNGSVDKFLGDGILASFGAALPTDQYAADALRAVDDLIAAADKWADERKAKGLSTPTIGVAVATGDVLFGAIGDESRLEYTVIGDAVNLSAKLEKHTKVEQVRALTTKSAYDLALTQGYKPSVPKTVRAARQVAGVDQPIDLAVLAGRRAGG